MEKEQQKKQQQKKQYFAQKEILSAILDDVTLKRWKVLSKAYKLGKAVWGSRFTRQRLANDMEMPMTTVLRCLSLDKANKKTWKLIEEKKISVFKVAQICMSKNITYQDEVVDMTIEDNLSTYQIASIRLRDFEDIAKEKHRLACEKGYSRKSSAYSNFQTWIERGKVFMIMDKNFLPQDKIPEIKRSLKQLNSQIKEYVR